ncbi:kinase-like domain-containing protein [Crucibulum laeve]|uniref:Kinase-like domain-containing protein n=1 Tax=Crucibulum laeve TaxID=68775 RepID=A0A5C3LU75_9AGAR|nr:kinase-like domain-containing protein [Crucibulum laeve]
MPALAESMHNARASPPFDPSGGVVTTDKLEKRKDARNGRPMINEYIIGKRIGSGLHGKVYICEKNDPNQSNRLIRFAMKSVHRDNPRDRRLVRDPTKPPTARPGLPSATDLGNAEAKIRKEIAIMKKCRHPHVVRLFEVIDDSSRKKIHMIMEYLGGGEVLWRNEKDEPVIIVAQTRRIMRDAILGLDYLHQQGIIHRDIKPANLLWTKNRQHVKIGDFGVSHFSYAQRLAAAGKDGSVVEASSTDPILLNDSDLTKRAGSPAFLAPEVVHEHTDAPISSSSISQIPAASGSSTTVHTVTLPNRPPITKAIDVWALGVTFYCLLFGRPPFTTKSGTEWSLYNAICNSDWTVPETMGADHVPTGGRHPHDDSQGSNVVRLLDGFLQKDPQRRITLEEVKTSIDILQRNAWILQDLPDPDKWIQSTSFRRIDVSNHETSEAMSRVRFSWKWSAFTQRLSSLSSMLKIRSSRRNAGAPNDQDGRGPVKSDPHVRIRRQKSAATSSQREALHTRSTPAAKTKRDKGKRKAETTQQQQQQLQAKPSNQDIWSKPGRPPTRVRSANTNSSMLQGSSPLKERRGSEPDGVERQLSSSQSSPTTSEKPKKWRIGWRGSSSKSILGTVTPDASTSTSTQSRVDAIPHNRLDLLKKGDVFIRRSEEALRSHGLPATEPSGALTAARRASSWGHGDEPIEFAEAASITSFERPNDYDMFFGAGGIERRNHPPQAVSSLAASPISTDPDDSVYDGPADYDFDSSTLDSTFSSSGCGDHDQTGWQNGGDLHSSNGHISDYGDDGDEGDEDEENAITFTPGRRQRED